MCAGLCACLDTSLGKHHDDPSPTRRGAPGDPDPRDLAAADDATPVKRELGVPYGRAVRDASAVLARCAHGAKVGALAAQGRSHLHRALASQRSGRADPSRLAVIEALLQSGADPSAADGLGVLPLSYPVLRGDRSLLRLLLSVCLPDQRLQRARWVT